MSAGHHRNLHRVSHLTQLFNLLREPWFVRCLERARRDVRVIYDCDLPYVAGSDTDVDRVYIDRHAYSAIKDAGLLPSLIEHEVVEGILERHGWNYEKEPLAAHLVASCAEERFNQERGISAAQANAVYEPLIKAGTRERLSTVPIDLNMKPYLETASRSLLAHMGARMTGNLPDDDETIAGGGEAEDAGKVSKESVDYGPAEGDDRCRLCRYFEVRGPEQCLKVMGDIDPWYWCLKFDRG